MTEQQLTAYLVEFIADILDLPPGEVGTDVPLEYLGVDSATALVLVTCLSEYLRREVRPVEVFDHPSVQELAEHLAGPVSEGAGAA
ncbi:acyl carrier protein [Streptomyces sp. NPDC021098]|uniref:acyl carrier protein n=1 Tax=unclassified Streptomyces TaxID=2593676 RepID=UPI00378DC7FA